MTLTVTATLVGAGVYHGSDGAGGLQWPPSPTRLLGAFVAAGGTEAGRGADETGLSLLEGPCPPRIFACRPGLLAVSHADGVVRYVASAGVETKGSARRGWEWHGLAGRVGTAGRPRPVAHPADPRIVYVWDDAEPTAAELEALRRRAARIGYLGGSESCVEMAVSDQAFDDVDAPRLGEWRPDGTRGTAAVDVPVPGTVAAWDYHFAQQQVRGAAHQRGSVMALRTRALYAEPATPGVETQVLGYQGRVGVWLRFLEPQIPELVLSVAEAMRSRVLHDYEQHWGQVPAWVAGHANHGPVSAAPRFVPVPNVGFPHSDGRILGAMLLVPDTAPAQEAARLAATTRSLTRLRGRGVDVGVRPARPGDPYTLTERRWSEPSRYWASAWPVLLPRWPRRSQPLTIGDVARWCRHAAMGEGAGIVEAALGRLPTLAGAKPLDPARVHRKGKQWRPHAHMVVGFDRPVKGPLVLGAAASFGLGLMAPLDTTAAR